MSEQETERCEVDFSLHSLERKSECSSTAMSQSAILRRIQNWPLVVVVFYMSYFLIGFQVK